MSLNRIFWVTCLVSACAAASFCQTEAKRKIGEFTIDVELPRQDVISQDNTGTCWSFATVSFLETELERLTKRPVDLSELFPVYWGYVEKSKRFVRFEGKAQFSEGGLSHDVIAMAKLHGLVPAADYAGLVAGKARHDHAAELFPLLETILKKYLELKTPTPHWEAVVRALLDVFLTRPPEAIQVDGRSVTPKQYADDILKLPYDDYLELTSFKYLPFGGEGELMVPDNWMRFQGYRNLPLEDFMAVMETALRKGFSVAVDMDVSEPGFKMEGGIAKLPEALEKDGAVTQELRETLFESKKTTDDHLMHVVGMATGMDGRTYFMTKNSWGKVGPHQGYLFMSRNYVALKMLAFMVHKDGI